MSNADTSRAFLFGLTLTELMILFVFLLTLLIGKSNADSKELDKRIDVAEQTLDEERLASAAERQALAREREGMAASRLALASLVPLVGEGLDSPGYAQAIAELAERFERLTRERDGLAARFEPITQYLSSSDDEDNVALDSLLKTIAAQLEAAPDPRKTLEQLAESVKVVEDFERMKLERDALAVRLEPITRQLDASRDEESAALDGLLQTVAAELEGSPEPEETLKLLRASLEAMDTSIKCAVDLVSTRSRLNDLQMLLGSADSDRDGLDEELQNCRRQVDYQQTKLNDDKGDEKIACWIDERGRRAYLFTVTMTPSGFRSIPAWPTGYTDRAMAIPGVRALADSSLSARAFADAASQIFDWSEQRDCRHTVRVRDSVGSDKDLYKRRLRQVEGAFYKFLMRG